MQIIGQAAIAFVALLLAAPLAHATPIDDCNQSEDADKQIAAHSDLVIVVGSRNSSNSVRLVEVALEAGARAAFRVDDASEIDPAWLESVNEIGVTSGASVPERLVDGVLDRLVELGFPPAVEERLVDESLSFALPPQLRKHDTRRRR